MAQRGRRARLIVVRAAFANPAIRRVLLAFIGFSLAEWMSWIAILVYAFARGGATETGVAALIQLAPAALVAPMAATFGDHFRRERALLFAYGLQASSMTLGTVALAAGAPSWVVYLAAALANSSITLTRPIQGALLPSLARTPSELTTANVASATIETGAMLMGPALAGLALALTGPAVVFALSAIVLVAGAVLVGGARTHPHEEPLHEQAGGFATAAADMFTGFRLAFRERQPRVVLAIIAAGSVLWGVLDVLLVVLAIDVLRIGDSGVGLLNAALGAGGLLGAAAASMTLIGRRGLAVPVAIGVLLWAVPLGLVGQFGSLAAVVALLAVAGLGRMLLDTSSHTLLQRVAPDRMLARIFGLLEGVHMGSLAIGSILAPLLVALAGEGTAFLLAAGAMLVTSGLAWPALRRLDTLGAARQQDVELLRGIPMFEPLGPAAIDRLACALVPVHAHPGTVVVQQGDPGDHFYIVTSGRVLVTVDGREVREEEAGESFGEIALLRSVPRTATVRALEPTEMVLLERSPFLEAVTGLPASEAVAHAVADARLAVAGEPPKVDAQTPLPVEVGVIAEDEANARA
ncbi:MAG TPA: cyclic nucleotide-binding domain-containing protein [Candidatus Limnocylindria bacterium]